MPQNTFVEKEILKKIIALDFTGIDGFRDNQILCASVIAKVNSGQAQINERDLADLADYYNFYPTVSFALQGKNVFAEYPDGDPEATPQDKLLAGRAAMLDQYFGDFLDNRLAPKQDEILNCVIIKYPDVKAQFESFKLLQAQGIAPNYNI